MKFLVGVAPPSLFQLRTPPPALTLSTPTHQVFKYPLYTQDDITEADMKIVSAFGDVVYQNYGTHLGGEITSY